MAVGGHLVKLGATQSNITFTDKDGVIYVGRPDLDPIYDAIAQETEARTLSDVLPQADVFIGLSVGGILKPEMIQSMADKPIVFALANPTPEIHYAEAKESRPDVIVATGRSDYPNQVNNVLGFPYIFRGALDCGATTVTIEMELAASRAIAELAREVVPDSVRDAYGGETIQFGPEYLIPKPVDQRVLLYVAPAVAAAAAESGVAARPIEDMQAYRDRLAAFLGRTKQVMAQIENKARQNPKKLVFPEGERRRILRAAHELVQHGICRPVLLGRPILSKSMHGNSRSLSMVSMSLIPKRATKRVAMQQPITVSDTVGGDATLFRNGDAGSHSLRDDDGAHRRCRWVGRRRVDELPGHD